MRNKLGAVDGLRPTYLVCRSCPGSILWIAGRLTFHTEVIHRGSHLTIGVDCYREVLMDQEVVPGSLADDLEIVYEGILRAHLAEDYEHT
jgi:hypothetical protein